MRLFFTLIILWTLTNCLAQEGIRGQNINPLWIPILKYPYIAKGKVISIKDKIAKIEISEWYKQNYKQHNIIKIREYHYESRHSEKSISEQIGLELNQEYIFILGTPFAPGWKIPIIEPEHRFKVINDSIFIPPSLFLQCKPEFEVNTFNDPLFEIGYKCSVGYFKLMIDELNQSYSLRRSRKYQIRGIPKNHINCTIKLKEPDYSVTGPLKCFLEKAEYSWEKTKCAEN